MFPIFFFFLFLFFLSPFPPFPLSQLPLGFAYGSVSLSVYSILLRPSLLSATELIPHLFTSSPPHSPSHRYDLWQLGGYVRQAPSLTGAAGGTVQPSYLAISYHTVQYILYYTCLNVPEYIPVAGHSATLTLPMYGMMPSMCRPLFSNNLKDRYCNGSSYYFVVLWSFVPHQINPVNYRGDLPFISWTRKRAVVCNGTSYDSCRYTVLQYIQYIQYSTTPANLPMSFAAGRPNDDEKMTKQSD